MIRLYHILSKRHIKVVRSPNLPLKNAALLGWRAARPNYHGNQDHNSTWMNRISGRVNRTAIGFSPKLILP